MTPLQAATATWTDAIPRQAWTALAIGLPLAALAYAGSCMWWPFGSCWCCSGRGKHFRKDGKVHRRCRWCKGSGARLRVGRRVWNRFAKVRKEAN